MNESMLNELLKINNNLLIPNYVIKYYKELNIDGIEFLLLIYLLNQKGNIVFDFNKIANDLFIEPNMILDLINSLNEKNYISIEMKKTNGIIEEFISIDLFYNKINSLIINTKKEDTNINIYDTFEQEFGRTLSPIEYQTINGWIENNISEELIKSALKEAILSGVNNLRYIDKILFEWTKKGYKNIEDIKNKKNIKNDYVEEIYDYDWINDN